MNDVLLSILIPTKNRAVYCLESIKTILESVSGSYEIVVQDNSTTNELAALLSGLGHQAISYHYHAEPFSFVENFERSIQNSRGAYLCLLGDDDSVTKDIMDVVKWMEQDGIETVTPKTNVDYIWPNPDSEAYRHGELRIPHFGGNAYQLDNEKQLHGLVLGGIINYQRYNLPRLYHGLVKRSSLDKVKNITGHYIGGLSPDIYTTIALACIVEKHMVLDYPFTIAGACPASATYISTKGGHSGRLADAPHFNYRGAYEWDDNIPRYYSVETIWAETALRALREMKRIDLYKQFRHYTFLPEAFWASRKFIPAIAFRESVKMNRAMKKGRIAHFLTFSAGLLQLSLSKIAGRFRKDGKQERVIFGRVETLGDALMKTEGQLSSVVTPFNTR